MIVSHNRETVMSPDDYLKNGLEGCVLSDKGGISNYFWSQYQK